MKDAKRSSKEKRTVLLHISSIFFGSALILSDLLQGSNFVITLRKFCRPVIVILSNRCCYFPVIGGQSFSKDICRSMIAMHDADQSGKLNIDEFQILISEIIKWNHVYKTYDRDNSGKLNTFELREALESSGFKLNNRVLNALVHRYGTRETLIEFDDFVMCAAKLKAMLGTIFLLLSKNKCKPLNIYTKIIYHLELFKKRITDKQTTVSFSLEDWIATTIY